MLNELQLKLLLQESLDAGLDRDRVVHSNAQVLTRRRRRRGGARDSLIEGRSCARVLRCHTTPVCVLARPTL